MCNQHASHSTSAVAACVADFQSATVCSAHSSSSLAEFIAYILAQSRLSKSVFVYALLYTHRFASSMEAPTMAPSKLPQTDCTRHMRVHPDSLPLCSHCLFLGTLMIAFKFTNDNCYKIKYWAGQ